MTTHRPMGILLVLGLLSACAHPSGPSAMPTSSPAATRAQTSTPVPSPASVDELVKIIWASNPEYPQYAPHSTNYTDFPDAVRQLAAMGVNGIDGANDLAVAIAYPRTDAYLAAQSLLGMGPDITATTIPLLLDNLQKPKAEGRIYSAILLGSVGARASCAAGNIHSALWDADPIVRSSAAIALERITGKDLVAKGYDIEITPTFTASLITPDTPPGKVAGAARTWWNEADSRVNWHPSYGICDP